MKILRKKEKGPAKKVVRLKWGGVYGPPGVEGVAHTLILRDPRDPSTRYELPISDVDWSRLILSTLFNLEYGRIKHGGRQRTDAA